MNTFIIAAITADGFIGRGAHHLSTRWTSQADKEFFTSKTKAAGVVVMGRSTFDTINRALPGRRTIVMTSRQLEVNGIEPTTESPTEIVARLKAQGVNELAICGGATVYTQFLQANVVDELFLTVHPTVFGAGVTLFNADVEAKLQLIEAKSIGDDTVLLHYSVAAS